MHIHSQAPAKIILSGEHAVVTGRPGLSMAIDLPTHCELTFEPSSHPFIEIELVDYGQKHAFPKAIWKRLATNIEGRYQFYQSGTTSIEQVLQHPVDLILITLYHFHTLHRIKPGHFSLKLKSHALTGRGLGSSAAVILSVLTALFKAHELDSTHEDLLILAQYIESRQHGQSSGIDPTTIFTGGLLRYQTQHHLVKLAEHHFNAWLIDTGKPLSTTGQCVSQVQTQFPSTHAIWQAFEDTTDQIQFAWQEEHTQNLVKQIRINHQLLCDIGVVPTQVQKFINTATEQTDCAAKICGAGTIKGEAAGMVLCISPNAPRALCEQFGYTVMPLNFQPKGVACEEIAYEEHL